MEDETDFHVILYIQWPGYDIGPVKFLADDTTADGVAVEANQHIEECGAVADNQFFVTVFGAENFLGKIERVMAALFVGKSRKGFQIFPRDKAFLCQGTIFAEKYMWTGCEQGGECKLIVLQGLGNDRAVEFVAIKNTDFASHMGDIIDDIVCLGFPHVELVFFPLKLTDEFYEGLDGKRVMLG